VKHSSTDLRVSRRPSAASERVVLICDISAEPDTQIEAAIAGCGATTRRLDNASPLIEQSSSTCCGMAVVSIGRISTDDSRPSTQIKALSDKGFSVIACMDGAATLPLAARCRLYLAGCVSLLDSAEVGFAVELERTLIRLVADASRSDDDDDRIRTIMADVGAVGESPALLSVFRRLARITPLSDLSTLITGETGTGKELLARAL
jgi:DNA-binding NtrC family response regulator